MPADVRTLLPLTECRPDDRVQSRARLSAENVAYLASKLLEGKELDPIVCFREAGQPPRYWNAHGHHRWHAHRQAGRSHIEAEIYPGTMRDAILWSVGCNDQHGLRRNNDDIAHAIRMMLSDAEWGKWTDRAIADQCKLHHSTVSRHRENWHREQRILSQSDSEKKPPARTYIHRSGKKTTINVANIGQRQEEANGVAIDEPMPVNLYAKFADDESDLAKLTKQMASSARKFWRFAYRVARLRGSDSTVDDLLAEIIPEQMAWARQKEIEGHRRKHGVAHPE